MDLRWDEATMECERIREEFVERLTGTLDPARFRAIDDHLSGCAGQRNCNWHWFRKCGGADQRWGCHRLHHLHFEWI